jgi:amino acid permease
MVGTGLLYQSGEMLSVAGPVSLCLAYVLMGSVTYALQVPSPIDPQLMQITLGEMISLLPIRGAIFMLPYRFLARAVVYSIACTSD